MAKGSRSKSIRRNNAAKRERVEKFYEARRDRLAAAMDEIIGTSSQMGAFLLFPNSVPRAPPVLAPTLPSLPFNFLRAFSALIISLDVPVPTLGEAQAAIRRTARLVVRDSMEVEKPQTVSMTAPSSGGVQKPVVSKKDKRRERSRSLSRKQ